jgi:hypothetical protein
LADRFECFVGKTDRIAAKQPFHPSPPRQQSAERHNKSRNAQIGSQSTLKNANSYRNHYR